MCSFNLFPLTLIRNSVWKKILAYVCDTMVQLDSTFLFYYSTTSYEELNISQPSQMGKYSYCRKLFRSIYLYFFFLNVFICEKPISHTFKWSSLLTTNPHIEFKRTVTKNAFVFNDVLSSSCPCYRFLLFSLWSILEQ